MVLYLHKHYGRLMSCLSRIPNSGEHTIGSTGKPTMLPIGGGSNSNTSCIYSAIQGKTMLTATATKPVSILSLVRPPLSKRTQLRRLTKDDVLIVGRSQSNLPSTTLFHCPSMGGTSQRISFQLVERATQQRVHGSPRCYQQFDCYFNGS